MFAKGCNQALGLTKTSPSGSMSKIATSRQRFAFPDSRSFCASIRDTSKRRIQMSGPQRLVSFVLACACSVIVARAQSQTTPGPEVKKLAVMVGKFTVEDELKAGAMGPNSPAMRFSGTEDCRWTASGFAVICEAG